MLTDVTPALAKFLKLEIEPIQNQCDSSFSILNHAFKLMGSQGLYALPTQAEMANRPLSKKRQFDNKALETKYSGALSFLTSQINLSAKLIYSGNNALLKITLLPKIFKGECRIANAISQLRNEDSGIAAKRGKEGWRLSGKSRWLTGFEHFEQFVLGFKKDKKEYFALLPFTHQDNHNGLHFSKPLPVIVMQATQTVEVTLNDWLVTDENIINTQEAGQWQAQMKTTPHVLPYLYGIALAALEVLQEKCQNKNASDRLHAELIALRQKITADDDTIHFINLRVKLAKHAWKCLQCAITASKGQAMDPSSRISRLYREIVQFNALVAVPEYITHFVEDSSAC